WTFTPGSGQGLKPTDGLMEVTVSVVAPDEKNQEYTGDIKIVNQENTSDYFSVPISLSTAKTRVITNLFQSFMNYIQSRFPIIYHMLKI
ncbi:MAG: hypothetical protein U9R21_02960, partial [Candidatus Thermoplasmatota archaeon]|nr:hypothetical protein [Candidatus Thermoplasmatota archaeon]